MVITITAAVAKNRVIGKKGKLPWRLPADLKHFRELTIDKPIIMGRNTFESLGKPLPKRRNIVLSRDTNYQPKGCEVARSIVEALELIKEEKEVIIGGGASIYQQFLPLADKMHLTLIGADFEGDAFFPEYNLNDWQEIKREFHQPDQENPYSYSFITLIKKRPRGYNPNK